MARQICFWCTKILFHFHFVLKVFHNLCMVYDFSLVSLSLAAVSAVRNSILSSNVNKIIFFPICLSIPLFYTRERRINSFFQLRVKSFIKIVFTLKLCVLDCIEASFFSASFTFPHPIFSCK